MSENPTNKSLKEWNNLLPNEAFDQLVELVKDILKFKSMYKFTI